MPYCDYKTGGAVDSAADSGSIAVLNQLYLSDYGQ